VTTLPIVAVIASVDDLRRAMRLRRLPDFFELRLDALHAMANELLQIAPTLRAPLIVTARHPAEGGLHDLSLAARRRLLLQFLPIATCVDVELRSAEKFATVLGTARASGITQIISMHNLRRTPPPEQLADFAATAIESGADILKVATRTNAPSDIEILASFFREFEPHISVSVNPIGSDARRWRLFFARAGSALNYTSVGTPQIDGQWSFAAFRRALERSRS
jgi:3-dehydroquinate dehydratase-1